LRAKTAPAVALLPYPELLQRQLELLRKLNRCPDFEKEIIRKYLEFLELEEYKVRERAPEKEDG
jgi:hypothetical protein